MNNYQKYRFYKNKYLQLKAGSPCTKHHGKPFLCWKTDGCFYKPSNGLCATKASLNPLPDETPEEFQTRNEASRQDLKSIHYQQPFYRDAAASLIGNRVRQNPRHREEGNRVQRDYPQSHQPEINITINSLDGGTLSHFSCHKNTPIMSLLEYIRGQTNTDLSAINLYLPNDGEEEESKEYNASNRDESISVMSDAPNINLIMTIGESDHEKLERLLGDLDEEITQDMVTEKWINDDIMVSLNLFYLDITFLPNSIGDMTNLQELNLKENLSLRYLSDNIGNLTNLIKLNIDGTEGSLTCLPDTIGNLSNLTDLTLHNDGIEQLPDTIGNLNNLMKLKVSSNILEQLPDTIGNLTNLNELDLSENELTQLPDTIGNLTNLTELDLSKNFFTQLPNSIGNLNNLVKLIIRDTGLIEYNFPERHHLNYLTYLPNTIGNLTNLAELDLGYNTITQLPDTFGNLTNLTELDLQNNKLTKLPDTIGNLTNLESINLWGNPIIKLPKTIGHLRKSKRDPYTRQYSYY